MNNKNDTSVRTDELDAMIMLAADTLMDMNVEEYESTKRAEGGIDKKTDRKILRALRSGGEKQSRGKLLKYTKRTLAAVLAACTLLFALMIGIGAVREEFINAVIKWYDVYFTVRYDNTPQTPVTLDKNDESGADDANGLLSQYDMVVLSDTKYLYVVKYSKDEVKKLTYQKKPLSDSETIIDSENCTLSSVIINGYEAMLAVYNENDKELLLIWNDGTYAYRITSYDNTFSKSDLIEIAESVK